MTTASKIIVGITILNLTGVIRVRFAYDTMTGDFSTLSGWLNWTFTIVVVFQLAELYRQFQEIVTKRARNQEGIAR